MKAFRADIRTRAVALGRDPDDSKVLFCVTPTLGDTDLDAHERYRRAIASPNFSTDILCSISAITEIDVAQFELDAPLPHRLTTNGEQGSLGEFQQWGSGKTLRELVTSGSGGLVSSLELIGTPDAVATRMGEVMEEVGGDGFLITTPVLRVGRRYIVEITDGLVPARRAPRRDEAGASDMGRGSGRDRTDHHRRPLPVRPRAPRVFAGRVDARGAARESRRAGPDRVAECSTANSPRACWLARPSAGPSKSWPYPGARGYRLCRRGAAGLMVTCSRSARRLATCAGRWRIRPCRSRNSFVCSAMTHRERGPPAKTVSSPLTPRIRSALLNRNPACGTGRAITVALCQCPSCFGSQRPACADVHCLYDLSQDFSYKSGLRNLWHVMERVTISLSEEFAADLSGHMAAHGYGNRSEAIRDLARLGLDQSRLERDVKGDCVATLSYVFNHRVRELSKRLTNAHHLRHDLHVVTTHVHLDDERCLEVAILRGDVVTIQAFANQIIAERGVEHGRITIVPDGARATSGSHGHEVSRAASRPARPED